MRRSRLSMAVLIVAIVCGAGWLIHRELRPKQSTVCEICGRGIMRQVEFHIETTHGTIDACCPACAMHYIVKNPGEARKELATDFNSGREIAARSAYYDMGGDVQYCTRHDPAIQRTMGHGMEMRIFDRCLPTLVAFSSKDDAEAYRQQHGGRIVTYEQAFEEAHSR